MAEQQLILVYLRLNFNVDAQQSLLLVVISHKNILDLLTDRNVNIDGIEIVKDGKTFFWSGRYHNDMNSRDTLATELKCLRNILHLLFQRLQRCGIVMLGNLHPLTQLSVLDQMPKSLSCYFRYYEFLDGYCYGRFNKLYLKNVDVITINDEEARQLSGEYSLVNAAKKIMKWDQNMLLLKKVNMALCYFMNDNMFYAPALPLAEVFDPTGAGDTFAGGFSGYLAKTGNISFENMKNAVIYGSTLASFCVEKFGTERMLTLETDSKYTNAYNNLKI